MARYIDAVNAAEIISDKLGIALSELVDVMATVPTADVQEVRRGRWECNYDRDAFYIVYVCSKCGRETLVKENFCPDCGAKMEEFEK